MSDGRLIAAVVLVDDLDRPTQVLAARRTAPVELAGCWEFPGGKVEPGEEPSAAARREVREELGVQIELGQLLRADSCDGAVADRANGADWPLLPPRFMRLWWAKVREGHPQPLQDHDELRWLRPEELWSVPWLPSNEAIVTAVQRRWQGTADAKAVRC